MKKTFSNMWVLRASFEGTVLKLHVSRNQNIPQCQNCTHQQEYKRTISCSTLQSLTKISFSKPPIFFSSNFFSTPIFPQQHCKNPQTPRKLTSLRQQNSANSLTVCRFFTNTLGLICFHITFFGTVSF